MIICQFLFIMAVGLHIPITLFPSREQIYIFYKLKRDGQQHFWLTLIMTIICVTVPCVYPDIIGLLGLIGGITVGTSGYILPFFLKTVSVEQWGWKKVFYSFMTLFAIVLGASSAYCSIFMPSSESHE